MVALALCLFLADLPAYELANVVRLADRAIEIDAGQQWETTLTVPRAAGQCPVLQLSAYTAAGGGCNYVLQILLDGVPLTDRPTRLRLLNKPLNFDPPGTQYHFTWFRERDQSWMTMFADSADTNWGGTGQDTTFLLDLSGLAVPGQSLRLGFQHTVPNLPALTHRERAPLVLNGQLGTLSTEMVDQLRTIVGEGTAFRTIEADPQLPEGVAPGPVAYELAWSQRPESPTPQVPFDDLTGWTLLVNGDAEVTLSASQDQRLWRPQVAKLTYAGGERATTAELRPPHPIVIEQPFDAADLWMYGGFKRGVDTAIRVSAVIEDAAGREVILDLGPVLSTYWGVLHGVLSRQIAPQVRYPAKFQGLLLSNLNVKGERVAYLESLALYQQDRHPRRAFVRPDPPVFPLPGRTLQPPGPDGVSNQSEAIAGGAVFTSSDRDGTVRFEVKPGDGILAGITTRFNDGPGWQPCAGGGLRLATGVSDPPVAVTRLAGLTLSAEGQLGGEKLEISYTLAGRSLVVQVKSPSRAATGLRYGLVTGLPNGQPVEVPYLLWSTPPKESVAVGDGGYVSIYPELYRSDFSSVDVVGTPAPDGTVRLLDGTLYTPLTDGLTNPLRETVVITASPHFAEVLPDIPNPPSPNLEALADKLFFMAPAPTPGLPNILAAHGVEKIIFNDFTRFFVKEFPEGFAGRYRPYPDLTVAQIQAYREGLHQRGYLFGAYLDMRDYFPLNWTWSPDHLALNPDGDWRDAWYGNHALKPTRQRDLTQRVGEKVHALYPPDCVYLDVHTNVGPAAVDFEAGIEGAGMARTAVLGNGDCILESRKWYGSTISEGIFRWLYAGVCDLDYAQLRPVKWPPKTTAPLLDFDLLKIHPLQHGTMMGYGPRCFLDDEAQKVYADPGGPAAPLEYHRYLAASLAYGHLAMLGYSYIPPLNRFIQTAALLQPAQREYLTDTVTSIEYHDGQRFLRTDDAIRAGAVPRGQVKIRYRGGLTLVANLGAEEPWTVDLAGRSYPLPPHGWAMFKPGKLLGYSALADGQRQDVSRTDEAFYLNAPAGGSEGPLSVTGAVWVKRGGDTWRVIPCGDFGRWEQFPATGDWPARFRDYKLRDDAPPDHGCRDLKFQPTELFGRAELKVTAVGEDGSEQPVELRPGEDGWVSLPTVAGTAYYRVE